MLSYENQLRAMESQSLVAPVYTYTTIYYRVRCSLDENLNLALNPEH